MTDKQLKLCAWTEDGDGSWQTDCKKSFCFNDGTPEDNEMNFCCFCGNKIIQERYKYDRP